MAPSWLGRSETIAYHRFGAPPFVARHALVLALEQAAVPLPGRDDTPPA